MYVPEKIPMSITLDNGREFTRHDVVAEQLVADIYFADPYASWEKGLNENQRVDSTVFSEGPGTAGVIPMM